jgi:hypothetical protein
MEQQGKFYKTLDTLITISEDQNALGGQLLNAYLKGLRFYPVYTAILTGFIVMTVGIVAVLGRNEDRRREEARKAASLSYDKQLKELTQTEGSIKNLLDFVVAEKERLRDNEKTLELLRSEHEKLKPLVEADRKYVEALFAAQERRQAVSVNRERWIGFGIGVGGSLIASVIFQIIMVFAKRASQKAGGVTAQGSPLPIVQGTPPPATQGQKENRRSKRRR